MYGIHKMSNSGHENQWELLYPHDKLGSVSRVT